MKYKIGELASEFGVTLRTLRHYEARGLISPCRTGTTRHYSEDDRIRLRRTLFAKRIGMQLADIPAYLELRQNSENGSCAKTETELRSIYQKQLDKLNANRRETDNAIAELNKRLLSL